MDEVRVYLLDYHAGERRICITDDENHILFPEMVVPHTLACVCAGEAFNFEYDPHALVEGTRVVMVRSSHIESCQLIHSDVSLVPVVHFAGTMPVNEFEHIRSVHQEHTRRYRKAVADIHKETTAKIEEYTARLKKDEKINVEMLGKPPSMNARLWRHLSSQIGT